jgi:hypothetical protein
MARFEHLRPAAVARCATPRTSLRRWPWRVGSGCRRRSGAVGMMDFLPWGGAYNRVRADATAFAHRGERFLLQHLVEVGADAAPAERDAARDWLARSWALAHPWGSGGVYPNFPDPDLQDWPRSAEAIYACSARGA